MTLFDLIPEAQLRQMLERAGHAVSGLSLALLDVEGRILTTVGTPPVTRRALEPLLTRFRTAPDTQAGERVTRTVKTRRLTLSPLRVPTGPLGFLICSQPVSRTAAGVPAMIQAYLQDLLDAGRRVESLAAEVARSYEEVTLFHRFFRQLGEEHRNLNRLCAFIEHEVEALLPVRYLSIMLVDEKTGELYTQTARDRGRALIASPRLTLGAIGHVLTLGTPTHVHNLRGHPLAVLVPPDITEALFVPLVVKTRAVGLLTVALSTREFSTVDLGLLEAVATGAAVGIENTQLLIEMHDLFINTVTSFVQAISSKDDYTAGHSTRVSRHVEIIAHEMDLPPRFIEQAVLAALLHDIGKLGTPDAILGKPTALSEAEWDTMKQHPRLGHAILQRVPQLAEIADWVKHEHEWYNGRGYPDRIAGETIPLASRIIAVADAFDAMTTDRVYRKGMPASRAVENLRQGAGLQFDPEVLRAFLLAYEQGRIQPLPSASPSPSSSPLERGRGVG